AQALESHVIAYHMMIAVAPANAQMASILIGHLDTFLGLGQLDACLIREKDSTSQVEICAAHEKRAVDQVVACKKDISSQVEIYAAREKRAIDQRTACTLREKDSSSQAEICAARESRAADQLAACKKVSSEQSEIYAAREKRVAEQLEFCTARGNDLVGKLGSCAAREKDLLSQLDASVAQGKSLDDQLKAVRKLTVLHALKKAEIKAQIAELEGKPLPYTFKGCYPDTDARIFNAATSSILEPEMVMDVIVPGN
ncbi:hypothetical protein GRF29_1g157507, partial [Pseudopithomyces chartarum]